MKLVAQAGPFAGAVNLVTAGVRAHKKKLPALLGAVRLVTAENAILIACSDNNIAIDAKIAVEVIEPG